MVKIRVLKGNQIIEIAINPQHVSTVVPVSADLIRESLPNLFHSEHAGALDLYMSNGQIHRAVGNPDSIMESLSSSRRVIKG